jgi:hypothetical protein
VFTTSTRPKKKHYLVEKEKGIMKYVTGLPRRMSIVLANTAVAFCRANMEGVCGLESLA